MKDIDIGKEFEKTVQNNPLFLKYFSNLEAMLEWYHAFAKESMTKSKSHHEHVSITIARRQGVTIEELITETKAIVGRLEDVKN